MVVAGSLHSVMALCNGITVMAGYMRQVELHLTHGLLYMDTGWAGWTGLDGNWLAQSGAHTWSVRGKGGTW